MSELWDVYNNNMNKIGKVVERGNYVFKSGEYHLVVNGVVINSNNEILLSKRASNKPHALKWECSGGSVLKDESSIEGIIREMREELGISFNKEDAEFFKRVRKDIDTPYFREIWVFKKDIDIEDVSFTDGEVIDAKWVNFKELKEMFKNDEMLDMYNFGLKDYEEIFKRYGNN